MSGSKRANDRYLSGRWGLAVAIGAATLAGLVIELAHGPAESRLGWFALLGPAVVIPLLLAIKGGAHRALRRGLQSEDPAALLDWYTRLARRSPPLRASLEANARNR